MAMAIATVIVFGFLEKRHRGSKNRIEGRTYPKDLA